MTKWEYLTTQYDGIGTSVFDKMGAQGWELVVVLHHMPNLDFRAEDAQNLKAFLCIWKRPKGGA